MQELKTSDYKLENYQKIYDYYRNYKPDANKIRFAANLLRFIYNPQVEISEEALSQATEHVNQNKPIIYAHNHVRIRDQFVVGTAIWAIEELKNNLLKGVVIPAKSSYFTGKSKLLIPTKILEGVGMLPVFRSTDLYGESSDLFKDSTEAYIDTCAFQLNNGINILVTPEGTRNIKDPSKILNIKQGIAKTAIRACNLGVEPLILPAAVNYSDEKFGFYKPDVYFGKPIFVNSKDSVLNITQELQTNLQESVDYFNN